MYQIYKAQKGFTNTTGQVNCKHSAKDTAAPAMPKIYWRQLKNTNLDPEQTQKTKLYDNFKRYFAYCPVRNSN